MMRQLLAQEALRCCGCGKPLQETLDQAMNRCAYCLMPAPWTIKAPQAVGVKSGSKV